MMEDLDFDIRIKQKDTLLKCQTMSAILLYHTYVKNKEESKSLTYS